MLKLAVKSIAAVLAAVAAVALGLRGAGIWRLTERETVAAVLVSAVLAAGSTVVAAVGEWRARRLGARSEQVDVVLTATVWAIVDHLVGIDFRDLGIAAYRLRRVWWAPWRSRLERIHRVRARRRPTASNVVWAPGKGVIGACVSRGEVVAQDLHAVFQTLGTLSRAQWDALPEDIRMGLSFAEYLDVRDKYDVVVATPVIEDSSSTTAVVGCVALDGPQGSLAQLSSDEVLGLLDSAGQTLLRQAAKA